MDTPCYGFRHCDIEPVMDELGEGLLGKRFQIQPGSANRAGNTPKPPWRSFVRRRTPCRRNQGDRLAGELTEGMFDQPTCGAVEPLQVIDRDQHRSLLGQADDRGPERLPEAACHPCPVEYRLLEDSVVGRRKQAGDCLQLRMKQVCQADVRRPGVLLDRPRQQHRPTGSCGLDRLEPQSRLADACLTGQQQESGGLLGGLYEAGNRCLLDLSCEDFQLAHASTICLAAGKT